MTNRISPPALPKCRMLSEVITDGGEEKTPRAREMRRLLERWERSGVPLAEYARRWGIAPGTLAWWRHTLRYQGCTSPHCSREVVSN